MENMNSMHLGDQSEQQTIKESITNWIKAHYKQLIIIMIVCALGLFIINQWLSFQFKAELLSSPCQLCEDMGYRCQKYIPINWSDFKK